VEVIPLGGLRNGAVDGRGKKCSYQNNLDSSNYRHKADSRQDGASASSHRQSYRRATADAVKCTAVDGEGEISISREYQLSIAPSEGNSGGILPVC